MNSTARSIVQEGTSILEAVNQAGKSGGVGGMLDALIAQIPSLLPKVTKGVQSLLSGLGKRLPGLVKNLIATVPDVLSSAGDMVPSLIESLTETMGAAVEGLITNLPQIATSLATGFAKALGTALTSTVGTIDSIMLGLLGHKKPTEYSAMDISGDLTYNVETDATVDNSGARQDVTTARQSFIEELQGYGLSNDEIINILGFKGSEEDIIAQLTAQYPNLTELQKQAIAAKLTGPGGEEMQSVAEFLKGKGLDANDIVEVLTLDETEIESALKEKLPDLKAIQIHAIKEKLTSNGDGGVTDLVLEGTDMGLSVEQLAKVLALEGMEEDIKAGIKEHCPNLNQAQVDALFEYFKENGGEDGLESLASDLGEYGLTPDKVAKLLVTQLEGGSVEEALKGMLPNLSTDAQNAILGKLNENGGIVASLSDELAGLGLTPETIAALLTAKMNGDDASVEAILEENLTDLNLRQAAADALQKAWENSEEPTFTSGTGDSSMGFMAQMLVDMFTNGKADDPKAVEAMTKNAKTAIDAARQEVIDYIKKGGDSEQGQSVLDSLDELDSALTNYSSNYAGASTAICEEQGAILMEQVNQCQSAVDSLTASAKELMSVQEILFNAGKGGAKLSSEDTAGAMTFINQKYKNAVAEAQAAKEDALKAGMAYEEAEQIFQDKIAEAQEQSRQDIAALLKGQAGSVDGMDAGAALMSVWDQVEASIQSHGGEAFSSEIEQILRDAGYGDDIIGQALSTIFGEQTYSGQAGLQDLKRKDFGDDINQALTDIMIASGGAANADQIANGLKAEDFGDDVISQVISELFTPDNMHTKVDAEELFGSFDFGDLGGAVQAAIQNGLLENPDNLDINQLILQMIGDSLKGTGESVEPPPVETGVEVDISEVTVAEGAEGKVDEAVNTAVAGAGGPGGRISGVTKSVAIDLEPEISEDGESFDSKVVHRLKSKMGGKMGKASHEEAVEATADVDVSIGEVKLAEGEDLSSQIANAIPETTEATTTATITMDGSGIDSSGMTAAATGAVNSAVAAASSAASKASSIGTQFTAGIASGIRSGRSAVISAAIAVAQAAIRAAQSALQIHSPSRVTEGFGRMFDQGFVVGIDKEAGSVVRSAVSLVNNVVGAANLAPKMDLSGLSASMNGAINDLTGADGNLEIPLYINDREFARATTRANNAALNGYAKRIGLGYGRG